ncbi:PIF1-like helicase-domain-containing protein [Mycena metata]|uniref:ATP-dependent DNA helicase n=1 Tax=Mycena metata TaxID=1033252 RepID=A0AAD7DEP5_9AGAR|nr:PIF1-like helicase-domain-containing protein [Mycena metata]
MLRITASPNPELIRNELLLALQKLLQGLGKSLMDIGLPEPVERQQEIDAERLQWGGDPTNLCGFKDSLSAEQRLVYDRIMHITTTTLDSPPPIHVDGRAGRGKTYVLYPIIGALRKMNEIVLVSASSAFAAKNYPGGRTIHYLYGIPVDEYNPFLKSSVGPTSDRARLLQAAKCHVIDEIGGLHFKAFDCADRLMRSLTGCARIWGGAYVNHSRRLPPGSILDIGCTPKLICFRLHLLSVLEDELQFVMHHCVRKLLGTTSRF